MYGSPFQTEGSSHVSMGKAKKIVDSLANMGKLKEKDSSK